jgi:hypothetical protein
MNDAFHSDFYVTGATVIPVLFLALTLQGSTFDAVIQQCNNIYARYHRSTGMGAIFRIGSIILAGAAVSVFVMSFVGEYSTILGLYYQRSNPQGPRPILFSMIMLSLIVILAIFGRYYVAYGRTLHKLHDRERQEMPKSSVLKVTPAGSGISFESADLWHSDWVITTNFTSRYSRRLCLQQSRRSRAVQ